MGFPEIVDVARNFAVMVRIQGPDPKGLKMRRHAFHLYNSGKTTLSASGMLLPGYHYNASVDKQKSIGDQVQRSQSSMLVLTIASVIEPFLLQQYRENTRTDNPQLIPGVQIDVMAEGEKVDENSISSVKTEAPCWLPAELLAVVNIPGAAEAVESILETSGSLEYGWEVGWSLVSYADGQQSTDDVSKSQVEQASFRSQRNVVGTELSDPNLLSKATTRIALLRVPLEVPEGSKKLNMSPSSKRGEVLLAMGSPFGILSPVHFFNSIAVGSVANSYQLNSSVTSLLMADIRCLPGMEGAPIFGDHSQFIGILIRPLRQRTSGAEVQMIMPWDAIRFAIKDLIQDAAQISKHLDSDDGMLDSGQTKSTKVLHLDGSSPFRERVDTLLPSSVEKAMSAICLITTGEGAWASGVLLNSQGLILTNAHLLEPWRFRKEVSYGDKKKTRSEVSFIPSGHSGKNIFLQHSSLSGLISHGMKSRRHETADISLGECKESRFSLARHGSQRGIRVRLDFKKPWTWIGARVVYISKGPLDIALLQLESIPDQLIPINADFKSPSAGSEVYVVGHGLFGPRYDLLPSACLGVIAKVVGAKQLQCQKSIPETQGGFPVMLETTAAVHPGGSGGAVINGDGCMVGLVTSNARHGGGMVIPHLNFSIPCSALEPIFRYSRGMQELSLLHDLDRPNEDVSTVWALKPAVSPRPGPDPKAPSFPEGDDKNRKGSRFSKFITELGDLRKGSNKLLPSKL